MRTNDNNLRAGFSEITLDIQNKLELAGYAPRMSTGVHDPLYAAAVFLDDSKQQAVICVLDVLDFDQSFVDNVRHGISEITGVDTSKIALLATHTHSAPSLKSDFVENCQWREDVITRTVNTAAKARDACTSVQLHYGQSQIEAIGENRRDPVAGIVDRSVQAVSFVDASNGIMQGLFVNHGCHPTTLGMDNTLVTADYPGYMRVALHERYTPRPVILFFNGACGDVNPGGYSPIDSALNKPIKGRTFERAKTIGHRLAACVIDALKDTRNISGTPLRLDREILRLPLRPLADLQTIQNEVDACKASLKSLLDQAACEVDHDAAKLELIYAQIRLSYAKQRDRYPDRHIPVELQSIASGEMAMLFISGEPFAELGLAIKERSGFDATFIAGVANANAAYFPTPNIIGDDSYEDRACMFDSVAINDLIKAIHSQVAKLVNHEESVEV